MNSNRRISENSEKSIQKMNFDYDDKIPILTSEVERLNMLL